MVDVSAEAARPVARVSTKFVNCLGEGGPHNWTPPLPVPELIDTWYFGRVLAAMEQHLEVDGLTVYLTFDTDELPGYGDDVVAVVIGDEWARVPAYLPRVRAVFRNLCSRPNLGCRPLAWPSVETFSSLVPATRAAMRGAGGRLRHMRAGLAAARGGRSLAPQVELPIGTYNLLDLPMTPFEERPSDLFFAGSIAHAPGRGAALKARIMPKNLSREAMLRNVESLRRRENLSTDVRLTGGFKESVNADPAEYSNALMSSRMALVPRGATTETHRFFQALKYGCVVVTDSVPPSWFYEEAPIVRLRHWDELAAVVMPLLGEPERLEALHRQSLRWWDEACSEEAVGRLMARTLNALA
jgi:hypothetical protein